MTLNLEQREIEAILTILSERAYREVHPLIGKIVQQANEQLAQPQPRANGEDAAAHAVQ